MTPADWQEIITAACIIAIAVAVAAVGVFVFGLALGWFEGSLSLRFVPPWKRKAAEPRTLPAAGEPDGTVQPLNRKAG